MGLEEHEPDTWTRGVMRCQPGPPLASAGNLQGHEFCGHAEWRPHPPLSRARSPEVQLSSVVEACNRGRGIWSRSGAVRQADTNWNALRFWYALYRKDD